MKQWMIAVNDPLYIPKSPERKDFPRHPQTNFSCIYLKTKVPRCPCRTSWDLKYLLFGTRCGNRTRKTVKSRDFKSLAFTSFATRARLSAYQHTHRFARKNAVTRKVPQPGRSGGSDPVTIHSPSQSRSIPRQPQARAFPPSLRPAPPVPARQPGTAPRHFHPAA